MKSNRFKPDVKKASRLILAAALFSLGSAAQAVQVCYDFSNMTSGNYVPGDTIVLPNAVVEVEALQNYDGTYFSTGAESVSLGNSGILGPGQELSLYLARLHIMPNTPSSKITMDFAQNTGLNLAHLRSNLGMNYERLQIPYGLASVNGMVFGNSAIGQIQVTSTLQNPAPGPAQWISGALEFTALNGGIETLTIGADQSKIDNVCFTN